MSEANVRVVSPVTPSDPVKEKVVIRGLSFFYGQSKALKDVTLSLRRGAVTAFIGPSGCGKSTLLLRARNRMYDLYPNQRAEGEVLLKTARTSWLPRTSTSTCFARASAWCSQSSRTPFPMSIYDNIAFGIRLYEAAAQIRSSTARSDPR